MAKQKESERKTQDYRVPQEVFVVLWETSEDADDCEKRFRDWAEQNGVPPMPRMQISARASAYREAGINLKTMPRVTTRTLRKDDLNELIEKIRSGQKVDLSKVRVDYAPPPEGAREPGAGARKTIRDAVKRRAQAR
jgi:hypothetical protein